LDHPQVPLGPINIDLRGSVTLSFILGMVLGIIFGFVRSYVNNSDVGERRKLRRVRSFLKKKTKDIILDRRVSGIISFLLLIGLPFYLGHQSKDPVYFGMYSAKLMLFNSIYLIVMILSLWIFVSLSKKK